MALPEFQFLRPVFNRSRGAFKTIGRWILVVTAALTVTLSSGSAMSQIRQSAHNAPPAKAVFKTVKGGFVAITVPDLDAAANWYVEKLGLGIVKNHATRADNKAAVTILEGNGFAVELIWLADSTA